MKQGKLNARQRSLMKKVETMLCEVSSSIPDYGTLDDDSKHVLSRILDAHSAAKAVNKGQDCLQPQRESKGGDVA